VVRGISYLLDGKEQADRGGSQQRAADAVSAVAFEILAAVIVNTASLAFVQATLETDEEPESEDSTS